MFTESQEIILLLESLSNKRARVVIEHILANGFITTEQLEQQYGYKHPPRAACDVREAGIPLETYRVKNSEGRTIAAYRFGDLTKIREGRLEGRRTFPKTLKDELYLQSRGRCLICMGNFETRYLQIDHRIPYEVAEEPQGTVNTEHFMLVCGSCNRAKSWSCEHCSNWQEGKLPQVCLQCYWANPENYVHLALREIRRTDIFWNENEIQWYEKLKTSATKNQFSIPEYIKQVIVSYFDCPKGD